MMQPQVVATQVAAQVPMILCPVQFPVVGSWSVGTMQVYPVPVMASTVQNGFVTASQPPFTPAPNPSGSVVVAKEAQICQKSKCKQRNPKVGLLERCERLIAEDDITAWSELPDIVKQSVWNLARSSNGARLLEKILFDCKTSIQVQMLEQLRGRVWEASTSREANYLFQMCIEVLPSERVQFIIDELKGLAVRAAQDRYAVRVLERLIEHCSSIQTASLVEEVLRHALHLCRHTFGNFLIQWLLEYGSEKQQHSLVIQMVDSDIVSLAKHKVGNHVISCALAKCSSEDVQLLTKALMPHVDSLSRHHSGSFVAKALKNATQALQ